MFKRILFIVLSVVMLLASVTATAQQPTQQLTWDDAPAPTPLRHLGDWYLAAGWQSEEQLYGDIDEPEYEVGDTARFNGVGVDLGRSQFFELKHKSKTAYFWFASGTSINEADLLASGDYFDTVIHPQVQALFGIENMPGIDGDVRLHLVHAEDLGFGAVGVFRPDDQCPVAICPHSNQRDALYYSMAWAGINTPEYFTTIAHEYQHLIRFNLDGNERRWLNEGLSQLVEHISGFPLRFVAGNNLEEFMNHTDMRLDGWADFNSSTSVYYGGGFTFSLYLYERFGLGFVQDISSYPQDGLAAVHLALQQNYPDVTLDQVFADWFIANYLDNADIEDGQYGYNTLLLTAQAATQPINFGVGDVTTISRPLNQYGADYFALQQGSYKLIFEGERTTPTVSPGATPPSGDWMWWGYEAEGSLAHLTRRVDLRDVTTATLELDLWYDLEDGFDWLDIMVLPDGETRWQPLQSQIMAKESDTIPVPHYTGRSPGWVRERLSLDDYAGEEILIRFEHATDSSITQGGVLLDNITIPEIDWIDDVETLSEDWTVDGFLRVPATVHQNWTVGFITNGEVPSVRFINLSADNVAPAILDVPAEGGVLVIGATAPLTAHQAQYSFELQRLP